MNEIYSIELGRQLMKPSGEIGKKVGENMNIANNAIYDLACTMIDFKDNERILEIGFGNGNFFPKYFKINPKIKVFGVDYSDTLYSEATSRNQKYINNNQLSLKCENSIKTSFESDYFNTIITINTIHFWNPIDKQIAEIRRILKRGGHLLIGFSPRSIMENLPFTNDQRQ